MKISDTGDVSRLIEAPVQNPTRWKATITSYAIHDNQSSGVSTLDDPIILSYSLRTDKTKFSLDKTTTGTLVALNSRDDSVHWACTLEPGFPENHFRSSNDMPQTRLEQNRERDQKFIVASPNGRYLAVRLLSYMAPKNPRSFGDQHTYIIVLDTETGNEVCTVEATGIVLGYTLTNDLLTAEIVEDFYPADTGELDAFSLTNPQEEPSSIRTNRRPVGATSESLLLAQQDSKDTYQDSIYTLTVLSIAGEEKDTIAGVAATRLGGWIERLKDPETVATIFRRDVSTVPEEAQRMKDLNVPPRDLINLETGIILGITGLSITEVTFPTGPGILLRTATTTEKDGKESTTYTVTSRPPATSEATELHTDDMQHIEGKVTSRPTHMGDEARQESYRTDLAATFLHLQDGVNVICLLTFVSIGSINSPPSEPAEPGSEERAARVETIRNRKTGPAPSYHGFDVIRFLRTNRLSRAARNEQPEPKPPAAEKQTQPQATMAPTRLASPAQAG